MLELIRYGGQRDVKVEIVNLDERCIYNHSLFYAYLFPLYDLASKHFCFEKCFYVLDKLCFQKKKEIENALKCQCLKRKISSIFAQACYWCSMHQEVAIFL